MKIKLKFKIGDEVFTIDSYRRANKRKVLGIDVFIKYQEKDTIIKIEYRLETVSGNSMSFDEEDIIRTKEEVMVKQLEYLEETL